MTSKIMVVDDDSDLRNTLQEILLDEGFDVISAEDGSQAIQMALENQVSLIFMDIRMPGINGVETYLEIKKISPESKVVMMTGYSAEALVDLALEEGVFAVLYKPLPVEQVLNILKSGVSTDKITESRDSVIRQR